MNKGKRFISPLDEKGTLARLHQVKEVIQMDLINRLRIKPIVEFLIQKSSQRLKKPDWGARILKKLSKDLHPKVSENAKYYFLQL